MEDKCDYQEKIHSPAQHSTGCVYLDYNASTPIDPRVLKLLISTSQSEFGNPHSTQHIVGREANKIIEQSSTTITDCFNAFPDDLIFTSGATEANNLALFGLSAGLREKSPQIITIETEHKSVLEPVYALGKSGITTKILPVCADGRVDLLTLDNELKTNRTSIVSISAANSEIGTIQPIAEIGAICSNYDCYWHCDATQAVGKLELQFNELGFDLLTFSGHKIYGPKGIGGLIISPKAKKVLKPIIVGGGQQAGYRSGTLPTFLCNSLSLACRLSISEMNYDNQRLMKLRNDFIEKLSVELGGILNGSMSNRLPNNINISFPGVRAIDIITLSPQIAISTGSACSSLGGEVKPSHVLKAIKLSSDRIESAIRIGLGRFTTEEELTLAFDILRNSLSKLRG